MSDAEKLAAIEALCRRYNNPSVNVGAHTLAAKVLKIIEAEEKQAG